ncbi:MAG TPA: ATP-binding cassette domain-containing protein, partial [Candidatus Limnocylindrales bacterium]
MTTASTRPAVASADATGPGPGGTRHRSPLVRFRGVSCGYDRGAVLRGIDLTIDEGAFVGIVGPSGAGKTTLLRAIVGAVPRIEG